MWAAVRELGTTIYWDGCDMPEPPTNETIALKAKMIADEKAKGIRPHRTVNESFIDHKCNIMEDLEELNCKYYKYELGNGLSLLA